MPEENQELKSEPTQPTQPSDYDEVKAQLFAMRAEAVRIAVRSEALSAGLNDADLLSHPLFDAKPESFLGPTGVDLNAVKRHVEGVKSKKPGWFVSVHAPITDVAKTSPPVEAKPSVNTEDLLPGGIPWREEGDVTLRGAQFDLGAIMRRYAEKGLNMADEVRKERQQERNFLGLMPITNL